MIGRRILSDKRGSTTVDFAFALPVLLILMLGTIQMGQYLHISGALRHAVGEGVRLAKVDPDATAERIKREVRSELVAMDKDGLLGVKVERGTTGGASYSRIWVKYEMKPIMPLIPVPPVTVTQEKTVWLPY